MQHLQHSQIHRNFQILLLLDIYKHLQHHLMRTLKFRKLLKFNHFLFIRFLGQARWKELVVRAEAEDQYALF